MILSLLALAPFGLFGQVTGALPPKATGPANASGQTKAASQAKSASQAKPAGQAKGAAPILKIENSTISIIEGGKTTKIPIVLKSEAKPPAPITFRRNDRFVVWDSRGLTIRSGKRTITTRFEGYPVSGKLFSKDQIASNLASFRKGSRTKGANEMAGAVRLGTSIYMLPRWTTKNGPWLEALIKLDLDADLPKPVLLGQFRGFTPSQGLNANALSIIDSRIVAVTQGDQRGATQSWGVSAYAPVAQQFGYVPLGIDLAWLDGDLFCEKTQYGTTIAGYVDRRGLRRNLTLETAATPVKLVFGSDIVSFEAPGAPGSIILADLSSGGQLTLPGPIALKRVPGTTGRFVAMDTLTPSRAWLIASGGGWEILARWTK